MIILLSSYLAPGDKDKGLFKADTPATATANAAKDGVTPATGGAKEGALFKPDNSKKTTVKGDPRFDNKIGLADIVMKADSKKVSHSQLIMEDLENMPADYKELEVTKECQLK